MRWSETYIPTLRRHQVDAEPVSHKLLLRGGYIRKLASGLYCYLPLMQRVIARFAGIVREEMNRAGALEIGMPALCPVETRRKLGRYDLTGEEELRIKDRREHEFVLCGSHEETIASLVAGEVRSYRQLPLTLYRIQSRFHNETRPRFGLMYCWESVTMDACSFDATEESFEQSYKKMVETYLRIFSRAGVDVVTAESNPDVKAAGKAAHEFVLPIESSAGEEILLMSDRCDYAATAGAAVFRDPVDPVIDAELKPLEEVDTPGAATIEQVTSFLNVEATRLVKSLICMADGNPVAALVRGDRDLNLAKLKNAIGATKLEMADAEEVPRHTGAPVGFAGPVGLKDMPIVMDRLVAPLRNMITGSNRDEKHFLNVNLGRDFEASRVVDITLAREGNGCPKSNGRLVGRHGIALGRAACLGAEYSEPLGAMFLDAEGTERTMIMGSYGIGISRTVQAILEKYHDDKGMIWPKNIAPYLVELVPLNVERPAILEAADRVYRELQEAQIEVLHDDRRLRPGMKFNDADLIGIPVRVVIGDKSLKEGKVEVSCRWDDGVHSVALEEAAAMVKTLLEQPER